MAAVINLWVDLCFRSWQMGEFWTTLLLRKMKEAEEYLLEAMKNQQGSEE